MSDGDQRPTQQWGIASSAGSSLVGPVILGVLLDTQLGWTPWATLTGIFVGLLGCVAILIRMTKRSE